MTMPKGLVGNGADRLQKVMKHQINLRLLVRMLQMPIPINK